MSFPFSVATSLTYVGYLLKKRKVSASTIDKYLSAIRMCHLQKGVFSPWIRPDCQVNYNWYRKQTADIKVNGWESWKTVNWDRFRFSLVVLIMSGVIGKEPEKDYLALCYSLLGWSIPHP